MSEPRLSERLRDAHVPDADAAEDRAWRVVRAANADRAPVPTRGPARRLVATIAAVVAVAAIVLTPAGAEVVDVVRGVVGVEDAQTLPELGPLPAAGELLVDSEAGPWIVDGDGSKNRLGDYEQSAFSVPRGLFVAATNGRRLLALESDGDVRWSITAPAEVSDPRWAPSGFRVAYRSGDDLRVVSGVGTNDHLVAEDVAPIAPAWRPTTGTKLAEGAPEQVSFVDATGDARLVDADTGRDVPGMIPSVPPRVGEIAWSADGEEFAMLAGRTIRATGGMYRVKRDARLLDFSLAPSEDELALLERSSGISTIRRIDPGRGSDATTTLFAGPGRIEGLTWSPDGRWLLAGWRDANQWLFIDVDRPRRLVAVDEIAEQFDSREFPEVSDWVLPQR
jgi:hypothetical protein